MSRRERLTGRGVRSRRGHAAAPESKPDEPAKKLANCGSGVCSGIYRQGTGVTGRRKWNAELGFLCNPRLASSVMTNPVRKLTLTNKSAGESFSV